MQIDIGTIEADPLSVGVKKSPRPRRSGRQNTKTTSWKSRFATPEKQAMVMHGMQTAERWSEARADRVEAALHISQRDFFYNSLAPRCARDPASFFPGRRRSDKFHT